MSPPICGCYQGNFEVRPWVGKWSLLCFDIHVGVCQDAGRRHNDEEGPKWVEIVG
jgi:hypothetical protein